MSLLKNCAKLVQNIPLRPNRPHVMKLRPVSAPDQSLRTVVSLARKTAQGKVNCACAGHPWPVQESSVEVSLKKKDCQFDFRKLEVNPFDSPCDCTDSPPVAGCKDLGSPRNLCCRTIRQYGCHCEEEELSESSDSCDEEVEEIVQKTCDLDFRKLEVNPFDDSCECVESPPPHSCDSRGERMVCRTPKPFGCPCDAYDQPGLECLKPKAQVKVERVKQECKKDEFKAKCL